MNSNLAGKEEVVNQLVGAFGEAKSAYIVGYQGTKCEDLKALRNKLRPAGAKLSVIKNTLTRRAIKGTAAEGLSDLLVGPTAVIWSEKDPVTPAKLLTEFAKDLETFQVKGGVVDGEVVKPSDIASLAKLPSREELLSTLLALINTPATRLLQTINAPASVLVRTLEAWRRELEKRQ